MSRQHPSNKVKKMIKSIPGTAGFSASEDGQIFDPCGNVRPTYHNSCLYKTVAVKLLSGKWQTFGVHRLVALAHLPLPTNHELLTVNHIDTDLENNASYNLEWVTVHLNNIHASMMRDVVDYPTILAVDPEGTSHLIDNLKAASVLTGFDYELIWDAIKNDALLEKWRFGHYGKRTLLPSDLVRRGKNLKVPQGSATPVSVSIKNLETGDIMEFSSIMDAGKYHQVSASHVYQLISKGDKKRLFLKKYLIVLKGEAFPDLTKEEYDELLAPGGKEVLAYNLHERRLEIYSSASSFIKHYSLSKKAVTVTLRNERLREIDGWYMVYNKPELANQLMSLIRLSRTPEN